MKQFSVDQRVWCISEGRYGIVTSGPRLRVSDMESGWGDDGKPRATSKFDVRFPDGLPESGLYLATELQTVAQHWRAASLTWLKDYNAVISMVAAVVSAIAAVGAWIAALSK